MEELAYVAVRRRLRPIRFGFLVRPSDSDALLQIIQLNTCLWGGRFNPIIPIFKRLPEGWSDDLLARHPEISKRLTPRAKKRLKRARISARQFAHGYLDVFEPDYLVEMTPGLAQGLDFEESLIVKPEDIVPIEGGYTPDLRVGLSVLPLYQMLHNREFRFLQKDPPEVILPRSKTDSMSLFIATCFGSFPSTGELAKLREAFRIAFSPKEIEIDSSNFFRSMLGPLRLGSHELVFRPRIHWQDPTIFLLDASRPQDLIDYWNLRALGWPVMPVPKQWRDAAIAPCSQQVREVYTPLRGNPDIMNRSRLLLSRAVKLDEALPFVKAISAPTDPAHPHQLSVSIQQWYPRIWDSWARDKDGCERPDVVADEGTVDCLLEKGNRIRFGSLEPSFVKDFLAPGAGWVNVIRIRDHSFASEVGTVFPSDAAHLERLLGTVGVGEISLSSEGIVVRCHYKRWTLHWSLPSGLQIFTSWLSYRSLVAQLSAAGKLIQELIRSTGGIFGTQVIADPKILQKLNKMAHGDIDQPSDGSGGRRTQVRAPIESYKEWWKLLLQITNNNADAARNHLTALVDRHILKIGLRLQCPICAQFGWHSLEGLAETLTCERCRKEFSFPAAYPPKDTDWCYRTEGPFSVGNFGQGGYCVALAIKFLALTLHAEASWVPSMTVRDHDSELEFDFGLFWRESRFEPTESRLLLGECKSFNKFDSRDFTRARRLAEKFPGTTLVFATLRPELEKQERERLARLAQWGRKRLRYEKLRAPVLVLTQHELLNVFGPPTCWREAGGKFANFAEGWFFRDFLHLCDATQQLHLGMESDAAWYTKDIERRRERWMRLEARAASAETDREPNRPQSA